MQRLNLLNLDLNLLVALDALVPEESVSRAASRIGVTQPVTPNVRRHEANPPRRDARASHPAEPGEHRRRCWPAPQL